MATYHDDNFDCYEIRDEDDVDFYKSVQKRSRLKKCHECGRMVRLLPDYAYCNSCADRMEQGGY